ncbi:phosphoribosyltransferase domain-containing protein, partial [Tsukamurella pulmonis]
VAERLDGPCVVFGFAETATGLGHCVAARLGAAVYLQSTRRPGAMVHGEFTEGHSHATSHLLQPSSPGLLTAADTLVLVDDEISTGATALDSIRALHALAPHRRYVVASLVDLRSPEHVADNERVAAAAGLDVRFTALAHGTVDLPDGLPARVAELTATPSNPRAARPGAVRTVHPSWPQDVPDGGRHGVLAADQPRLEEAAAALAAALAPELDDRPVIVVGHEELMYLPLCMAESLAHSGFRVRFQTTTRSPALVRDEDGYPLRRGFEFLAPEPDEEAPRRHLYNAAWTGEDARIVFVADTPADTERLRAPDGLLDVLTAAGHDVLAVIVPASDQAALAASRTGAAAR